MYYLHLYLSIVFIHQSCAGELHPSVFGGRELRPHVHKYLVQLVNYHVEYSSSPEISHSLCSGTILNERWIISAAHCFSDNQITYVEVQNYKLRTIADVDPAEIILMSKICGKTITYERAEKDLALLKTERSIKFDSLTQPIKLSKGGVKIGQGAVISGFGETEYWLQSPTEGSVTIAKCSEPRTNLICTQGKIRAGDGDSGGPLVSKGRLVGVTSATTAIVLHEIYETIYVDVSLNLDWINEVMFNHSSVEPSPKLLERVIYS